MRWIEATIQTTHEELDALCAKLEALGVEGLCIEDEQDFQKFLKDNQKFWDFVDETLQKQYAGLSRVRFYVSDDAEGEDRLLSVAIDLDRPITTKVVNDEDWENNWKQFYEPIAIGKRLMVVPEWLDPELDGRKALRLDPGLTFGTGSHATTRMCLEALDGMDLEGKRVLDLGCGSGILGIAALLLGAKEAVACDIDPNARQASEENAALSGVAGERFRFLGGDVLSDESLRADLGTGYDLVLANIVADVIEPLSAFVRRFMAPDARFLCSGVIDHRAEGVESTLRSNGFEIIEHRNEEEWHCYLCR
ncbi:MAG: 50S ribosomal protein L11 methyltransferase [Oscillospiraceae bacterium]|nr:50S ribosomal protein L11 methyltransferase [Oscillospiraceae bacterium]